MKAVYQSTYNCSIERQGEELWVQSSFISTECEATAQLKVDVKSFRINNARWDVYRCPQGYVKISRELPELIGIEAYYYAGSQIRRAVGEEMNRIPLELITECIRGVGQAEAFLIPERGFPVLKDFDEYCQKIGLDSCRYYSNLDRIAMSWTEYMGEHSMARDKGLFYRQKNYLILLKPDASFITTAGFIDSFHEIVLVTSFSPDGVVSECGGDFLRGPDKVCFENVELLPHLIGNNLPKMSKKEIAAVVGGSSGCTHLLEILWDLRRSLAAIMV